MAFYPNAGALWLGGEVRASLAASEIRLFQAGLVTIGPGVTLAELDAAECDFTGYAAAAITNWNAAGLNPAGGASISANTQFATASPYTVGNVVGGYYVVADPGGTPALVLVQEYPNPGIPMEVAGQILPVYQLLLFGTPNL